MAKKTFNTRIQTLHDTKSNWDTHDFSPLEGEIVVYQSDNEHISPRLKIGDGNTLLSNLPFAIDYNETIIGLSVDGTTITYVKGDGSVHSFETQDTNTTYSLGTDSTTGLTKLYATIGSATDGTMTQQAIKTELDKKVGVRVDSAENALIFTI